MILAVVVNEDFASGSSDLLYLNGNIEILAGETFFVVGSFAGALLLLPSIEELADGVRKVRAGNKTIEILLFALDRPPRHPD